jgi:hypothetical protein
MAELKTKPHKGSVAAFIEGIPDDRKRRDAASLLKMMQEITGERAVMWGPRIVGFGKYHYRSASGREGDWFLTAFSPNKQNLSLYIMAGFEKYGELLERLGRHSLGKGCLYIRSLEDVHLPTLKTLVKKSVAHMKKSDRG